MTYKWSFLIGFCAIAFSCNTNSPYRQQGYNQPGYGNQPGNYNNQNNNNQNTPQASQGNNNNQNSGSSLPDPRDDVRTDREREELFRRERDRCRDESSNHQCKKDCKLMYKRSADRKDCERLSEDTIEDILAVHENLEDLDTGDIDLEDLETYLKVSINGLTQLIEDYGKTDARNMLEWITDDEDIAEIFEGYDEDFEFLQTLLDEATSGASQTHDFFTYTISNDKSLFEMALGNEVALDWFLDFLFATDSNCNTGREYNTPTARCFKIICEIGNNFDGSRAGRRRSQWLQDSSSFESYIRSIIEEDVLANASPAPPATCWIKGTSSGQINSVQDLPNNDFLDGLCKHTSGNCFR